MTKMRIRETGSPKRVVACLIIIGNNAGL